LAGTIIADRIQLDNLTDTFKVVSNTNVDIITANSSGILTGVANNTISESKIVDGAVTNAKLTLAANASAIKTALNASGDPGIFAARAWVNFDGTGTVAIRASGNVSSITDNGTGDYTVNFTNAMPDANYCVNVSAPTSLATNHSVMAKILGTNAGAGADLQSTTQIRVVMTNMASTAVYADVNGYCVAVFR
jgi:hypothetical protein